MIFHAIGKFRSKYKFEPEILLSTVNKVRITGGKVAEVFVEGKLYYRLNFKKWKIIIER